MGKKTPLTVGPGKVVQTFTPEQARALGRQWVDAFPSDRNGIHADAFMWHVFSYERFPSVSLDAALAEYEKHTATEYLVLTNAQDEALVTDQRPTDVSAEDYIVCPLNWAWTMAFTHEDGWLGPYFARHRKFETLQSANTKAVLAIVRKREETERAKQKGWA
jgi:hypothetical protein